MVRDDSHEKSQWINNLVIRGLPESDETEDKSLVDSLKYTNSCTDWSETIWNINTGYIHTNHDSQSTMSRK